MSSNNRFADIKAFLDYAVKLGTLEAQGELQRPEYLRSFVVAVREGHINPTTAHCAAAWQAFISSKKRKNIEAVGLGSSDSDKPRISDLKSVAEATLMTNVDFGGVLDRAMPIMQALKASNTKLTGNTWDCFAALSRAQRNHEGASLTDDQIKDGVQPKDKAKAAYTEENEYKKLIKQLTVLHDGTNPTENSPGKEAFPSPTLKQMIALAEAHHAKLVAFRVTKDANDKLRAISTLIPANNVTVKVA